MQYTPPKIVWYSLIFLTLSSLWTYQCSALDLAVRPAFSIWDIKIGEKVFNLDDSVVGEIGCGTGGGPIGKSISSFKLFQECDLNSLNLYELVFSYDDEQQYIAKALNIQNLAMTAVTTVYSHQAIVSLLADTNGDIVGYRIVSDPSAPIQQRARTVAMGKALLNRFRNWEPNCIDKPPAKGEMPIADLFVKTTCNAFSPDGSISFLLDMSYFRKAGQNAININTQNINTGYFEGRTVLTVINSSYPNASLFVEK